MTAFIAIAAVMLALACAWVLVPLLRRHAATGVAHESANLSVLRDQRAELEADLANGTLSAEQYESARTELDRRVLEETATMPQASEPSRPGAWTAAVVSAMLPIVAVVLYVVLGTPGALVPDVATTAATEQRVDPQQIESMIERVKERLAREPDNIEGWAVLARTYYALGRAHEAAAAFERATALAPDNPDLLADYADAVGITQNQSLDGKPAALIERALSLDANHWKANALAGTLAFAHKDYGTAIEHWERVRRSVPPESPVAQSIDASIAEARQLARASKTAVTPPGPRAAVAGTVSLSPSLASTVSPEDTVFVFARPADGSRMPLAVVRGKVRELPLAFTLDDSRAMTPTHRISDHGEVIVGARVSRSGTVTPQPGDIEIVMAPVKVGASGLALVIERKTP